MDKRIKTIQITICNGVPGVIINNTYEVWGDGLIYDYRKTTNPNAQIPLYIFKFRDELLGE